MKLCECQCGTPAQPGKRFAKHHYVDANGRVRVRVNGIYKYRYRLVMEQHIGRELLPGEVVHHKNKNRLDDRIENLELCTSNAEHMENHHSSTYDTFICLICGKEHKGEKRRKYHFCSRECWRKWSPPGAPRTHGLTVKRELTCAQCSKVWIGKSTRNGNTFCCRACYTDFLRGKKRK